MNLIGQYISDVGNILSIVDSLHGPQTQAFSYDGLQRLTSANASGGSDGLYSENYTYDASTGNLASKGGVSYTYNTNHPHAVSALSNGNTYGYDANGNMTQRVVGGQTYTLAYDAENRLVSVVGPSLNATFTYDADGKRVQQILNGVTTKFIGSHYEVEGTTIRKYYFAGATRIAMRTNSDSAVYFLQDHLGSTSITTDSSGNLVSQLWYKAWGEVRYSSGTTPTKYTYTGQYSNTIDFGLMYYGARWYDPAISHFTQPDTIIPGQNDPQAYDRYAYTNNNPLTYIDPSGHMDCNDWDDSCGNTYNNSYSSYGHTYNNSNNNYSNNNNSNNGNNNSNSDNSNIPTYITTDNWVIDVLNTSAKITQVIATLIDLGFAIPEVIILVIGLSGGVETIPVVINGMDISFNVLGGNAAETFFSGLSLGFTFLADVIDDGKLGEDTLTSASTFGAGLLMPDPLGDLAIDSYASLYTFGLMNGIETIMNGGPIFKKW